MNFVFFPAFKDATALHDHVSRAAWFLRPLAQSVLILHDLPDEDIRDIRAPAVLDQSLTAMVAASPFLNFERNANVSTEALAAADAILLHDSRERQTLERRLRADGLSRPIVRVDHAREQYAASFYLKLSERAPGIDAIVERSKARFGQAASRLASRRGYIFGTGPNLALTKDYDFSDGVAIACNSMVVNQPLLDRIQPKLITIADPIFHAGPSAYAAEFRRRLIEALDRYNCPLITPLRDALIYEAWLPQRLKERLICVPFLPGEAMNSDLTSQFHVTSTSNILTLMLLPLAATLFDEIVIAGCDGRPMEQNSYFWGHDAKSQINSEMDSIRAAHPAFFAISYDDYYKKHCDTLARWIERAEECGRSVVNLTPSYIPALAARTGAHLLDALAPKVKTAKQ